MFFDKNILFSLLFLSISLTPLNLYCSSNQLFKKNESIDFKLAREELLNQTIVEVDFASLKNGNKFADELSLSFADKNINVKKASVFEHGPSKFSWLGKTVKNLKTIFTVNNNLMFGRIEYNNEVYLIEPVQNGPMHKIIKQDENKLLPFDNDFELPDKTTSKQKKINNNKVISGDNKDDDGSTIDLLILYTDGMAQAFPGNQLETKLNFLIDLSNQAYFDSRISTRVQIAKSIMVTYSDAATCGDALYDLQNNNGVFKDVEKWRDQYGADLVMLLSIFYDTNINCGRAFLLSELDPEGEARWGYGVTELGYRCSDYTFTHEIGHNMGCAHDKENSNVPGIYNYSYGYDVENVFATIMSYDRPRIGYFSNPDISYKGYALGVANEADNAKTINLTKETIANFRKSYKKIHHVEFIKNGGFESTINYWIIEGDFHVDSTLGKSFSGEKYISLSDTEKHDNNDLSGKLYQLIDLPDNLESLTLKYRYKADSEEYLLNNDSLTVGVEDLETNNIEIIDTVYQDTFQTYLSNFIDLLNYSGKQIKIFFNASTDSTLPTEYLIDDVSLDAVFDLDLSAPSFLSGDTTGTTGEQYSFFTNGALPNLDSTIEKHSIAYRYNWGDGSYSTWNKTGLQTKKWSSAGIYQVKSQAKCEVHEFVTSDFSDNLNVNIKSCVKMVYPEAVVFGSNGGISTVDISTLNDCPWNAVTNDDWITITSDDSFRGDGSISFSVDKTNLKGKQRDGRIFVGDGKILNITQFLKEFRISTVSTTTTEAGGTASFLISLYYQPTSDVRISVASSDPDEGQVSSSSLVFNKENWDIDQKVTVTGINDKTDDGPIEYTIILYPAESSDIRFNGVDPDDIDMINFSTNDHSIDEGGSSPIPCILSNSLGLKNQIITRDRYLLNDNIFRTFVKFYYNLSPSITRYFK